MANTKFTGRSDSYIFEDAGGKRDQLEQAILNELQAKQYPLKATSVTRCRQRNRYAYTTKEVISWHKQI